MNIDKKLIFIPIYLAFIMGFSYHMNENVSREKSIFYYVPPGNYMKVASGSFDSASADVFYATGVIELGENLRRLGERYDWIYKNMDTATDLDPKLEEAYFLAGLVAARGNRKNLKKSIALLEKGVMKNPTSWRILYWLGYNNYRLAQFSKAIHCYTKASKLPGAPNFLRSNPIAFYYMAGEAKAGMLYIEGLKRSVKVEEQKKWMDTKHTWLENLDLLENKVEEYKKLYGKFPENLNELVDVGLMKKIPEDPFGKGYFINPRGKVKSRLNVRENKATEEEEGIKEEEVKEEGIKEKEIKEEEKATGKETKG